jgi:hypothetical protein
VESDLPIHYQFVVQADAADMGADDDFQNAHCLSQSFSSIRPSLLFEGKRGQPRLACAIPHIWNVKFVNH